MKEIFERRSIRKFQDEMPSDEQIKKLIAAGMQAPSAGDVRDWCFIVIKDKARMSRIMEYHQYSGALKTAPLIIVVCARKGLGKYGVNEFWEQDCCAATENMLIEAQYLGLGAVWLAMYPWKERLINFAADHNLPEDVVPISIVAVGKPVFTKDPIDKFDEELIYSENYGNKYVWEDK